MAAAAAVAAVAAESALTKLMSRPLLSRGASGVGVGPSPSLSESVVSVGLGGRMLVTVTLVASHYASHS
jgi:hypothetical protein